MKFKNANVSLFLLVVLFHPGLFGFRGGCFGFDPACLELFDSPRRVDQLFLASVERMALGADFHVHLGNRGPYGQNVPARADNFGFFVVCGMNVFLHIGAMTPSLNAKR